MDQREYRFYEVYIGNILMDYWIEQQPNDNKAMKSIKKIKKKISKINIQCDEKSTNQPDSLTKQLMNLQMS